MAVPKAALAQRRAVSAPAERRSLSLAGLVPVSGGEDSGMKTGLIVIAALALAWSAHGQPYQMGAGTQDRQWLPERAHPETR